MDELPFTGERFIPGTRGEIWVEHWHRYHFARPWVAGKRVLDIACGEGYGSALLARDAQHVTGVDVSEAAVAHARAAYAAVGNAAFLQGSCEAIPLADASVDVVVSFETLEHIAAQEAFVDEIARVLAPSGVVLLSCPNKAEYSDRRGYANEFHVKELYRDELAALLARRFPATAWFDQKPDFFSVIAPQGQAVAGAVAEVEESAPADASPRFANPMYFIVAAGRDAQALAAVPAPLHVFADRGEWVRRDYEKVMGWMQQAVADRERLQREVEERDRTIAGLRRELGK